MLLLPDPLKVRAKGGAWSVVSWSVGNAVVAEITPPLLAAWDNYTFLLFGLINFVAIPIVWALYPGVLTIKHHTFSFSTVLTTICPYRNCQSHLGRNGYCLRYRHTIRVEG